MTSRDLDALWMRLPSVLRLVALLTALGASIGGARALTAAPNDERLAVLERKLSQHDAVLILLAAARCVDGSTETSRLGPTLAARFRRTCQVVLEENRLP